MEPTESRKSGALKFVVYEDWRGMYRWKLLDEHGRCLEQSQRTFAALSGGWRDAVSVKLARFPDATVTEA